MKTKAMKCLRSYNTAIFSMYQTTLQFSVCTSADDSDQVKILHKVAFGGDHLTVERGIGATAAVSDSDTSLERLEGLFLKHEDFHCEMNVLQVGYITDL